MRLFINCREVLTGLSAFSYKDKVVAEWQMARRSFDHRFVYAVSCRCNWGYPQALMCRPYFKGMPFPTLFWLTCPYLSKICGMIESIGAVHELEDYLEQHIRSYNVYNNVYSILRIQLLNMTERYFLRKYHPKIMNVLSLTGIGGMRMREVKTVKCLHLQTATFLSLRGHPAEKWLRIRLGDLCCKNEQCASAKQM